MMRYSLKLKPSVNEINIPAQDMGWTLGERKEVAVS
jgi:hypothetical protein